MIDPQRFHPSVPDVAGIARAGHARETFRHRTAIARSEKLPLLQREMRQLIKPDEQKLRALILVNVIFVATVAKASGRAIEPGNYVLRFVVTLIELPRHVAPKIRQQR